MKESLIIEHHMAAKQNESVREAFEKEKKRLLGFIMARVPGKEDAEDILQDVFFQLTESYRVERVIGQLSAWLFTVARNKITDWFRKQKPEPASYLFHAAEEEDADPRLENFFRDLGDGPEAVYARKLVLHELEAAIDELPQEQREVFVMHELEEKSFAEISRATGVPLKTLLSRKHYAVLFLRKRLREIYQEFVNH